MRTYAISTLFLVSILVTGACAGRQVRARSVSAPPIADAALTVAPEPVPAPTPVVEPAPVEGVGTTDTIDGPKQASEIAQELASTDFDVLGTLERDNGKANVAIAVEVRRMTEPRTRVPHPSPYGDAVDDAYRIDRSRLGALRRHADLRFDQMWRELEAMLASDAGDRAASVAAVVPRHRRTTAPAVDDGGREAVVGSLASAPSAVSQALPASAGPSILPAPPGAPPDLTAGPATDRPVPSIFVPDPSAVQESLAYWSRLLIAVFCAIGIGILFGCYSAWRRYRRFRACSKGAYDHLPDGTFLIQEVVGGELVTRQMFPPDPLPSRSEPETSEQEAKMDAIEETWHAAGAAMDDEDDPQAGTPPNKRFDLTDTEEDAIEDVFERTDPQPPPVPIAAPDILVAPDPSSPHVQPESDDATRLAAGTGKIISCSDDQLAVSGVAHASDPPREPRSEPVFQEKVIIYEDDSSNAAAMTAATSTPN